MRILNIISNEIIIEKQKLENELERVLNSPELSTEKMVKESLKLLNKLTQVSNTMLTWESYITKVKEENKKN
tara:strand:+ start:251 stop:466 length:216 start_codon:yes stop_codon:yes gene_type:complete